MGCPVTRWQILARDPEKSARFYTELFDWRVNDDNPLGYRMIETGNGRGIQGGIWPAPPEARDFVQLHVEVEDVAVSVAKAESLGARVVVPRQVLPEGGEMAVLVDPQGLPVAVYKPA